MEHTWPTAVPRIYYLHSGAFIRPATETCGEKLAHSVFVQPTTAFNHKHHGLGDNPICRHLLSHHPEHLVSEILEGPDLEEEDKATD